MSVVPPRDSRLARNESLKQKHGVDEKIQEYLERRFQKRFPIEKIREVDEEIITIVDDVNVAGPTGGLKHA